MGTATVEQSVRRQQEERLHRLSGLVAAEIGGDVTDSRIKGIIQASNTQGVLFHGIARNSRRPEIIEHGIKPLTPESNYGNPAELSSFWTTGKNLFGELEYDKLVTNDATFFNYSHAIERAPQLNIAVTTRAEINKIKPVVVTPNSVIEIPFPVPPTHLTLLTVPVDPDEKIRDARNAFRQAERRMVDLIEGVLDGTHRMGKVIELAIPGRSAA